MATLGNTTITNLNSGTIRIQPILGDYQEGIRIQPNASWSTIMLLGTDASANASGTSTKSWGIFNNDGNFYINKGASNAAQSPRLWGHANGFTIGNSNTSSYALNTASFICDSWVRTKGDTGWYNESYGGGWYMKDSTYVRNYNSKQVLLDNLLTLSSGESHKGVKIGNTYINAIDGDLILQNNSAIRFGGDEWNWNVWAGLKYVHSSKTISLGLADGSAFQANNAQSGGTLNFPGIGTVSIGGALTVAGTSTFTGKTTHNGGIGAASLSTTGNTSVGGTLAVTGTSTFTGKTTHNSGIGTTTLSASSTSTFTGKTTHNGGIGTTTLSASGQITSTVASGTAPFVVASSTKVTNLNADYLDGHDSTAYLRKVTVGNTVANDFNTFENMTLTGRGDPASGCPALKNSPWSGNGPAGGYGVLTYLWSNYGTQMAWGYNSNRIYIRNKYYTNSAVNWSSTWDSLALVADLSSYSPKTHTHTASAAGSHTHTTDSQGSHTHTTTGTAAAAGSHTHTTSGTAAEAGSHTHTVSGTVTLSGSVSGGVLTITASFSSGAAAAAGAHTHTTSGTAAAGGSHTHTTTGTAAAAGSHTHTATAAGSHTHSVPAS